MALGGRGGFHKLLRKDTALDRTTFNRKGSYDLVDLVEFFYFLFKKSVKTAVPDAGNPPGALVLTKLAESSRFGVGGFLKHFFFLQN